MGQEDAYAIIQKHAKEVAAQMVELGLRENNLYERLGADSRFPFRASQLRAMAGRPVTFTGDAAGQVGRLATTVEGIVRRYPAASTYTPVTRIPLGE